MQAVLDRPVAADSPSPRQQNPRFLRQPPSAASIAASFVASGRLFEGRPRPISKSSAARACTSSPHITRRNTSSRSRSTPLNAKTSPLKTAPSSFRKRGHFNFAATKGISLLTAVLRRYTSPSQLQECFQSEVAGDNCLQRREFARLRVYFTELDSIQLSGKSRIRHSATCSNGKSGGQNL